MLDIQGLNVTKLIEREGWDCAKCGHRHAGRTLAYICVGCPCPADAPTPGAVSAREAAPGTPNAEQLTLGRSLRGTFVRFHQESKVSRGYLVIDVSADGMIELQGFSGLFAPYLFERVDHPHSAAEGNC